MPGKKLTQSDKFIQKARELGCDESEAAFEKGLKRIAKASPAKTKQVKKPPAKK